MFIKFFKLKRRASIKAKYISGGRSKVTIKGANMSDTLVLMYSAVRQIGKMLRQDTRFVLNRLIDLDKEMARSESRAKKELRMQDYKNKNK